MKRKGRSEEAENPFWITYSDLLSSMVLLLLILLVVFIKISEAQRIRLEEEKRHADQIIQQNRYLLAQAPTLQARSANLRMLKKQLRELRDFLLRQRKLKIELQDNDLTLSVDQTLLFDEDSDELKPAGKEFLEKFIPPLAATITKKEYRDLITGIVFEGRADPSFHNPDWNDAYQHNLGVTLDRSKNVVKYVFGQNFQVKFSEDRAPWFRCREKLRYLVLASGRSSVDRVKREIPDPDSLRRDWKKLKLWERKDASSRQVVIRLELYNPLPDFKFDEPK